MTRVKICGMMRSEDVEMASDADYVGFVVGTGTRRSLTVDKAQELMTICARPRVAVSTATDINELVGLATLLEPEVLQISAPVSIATLEEVRRSISCHLWATVHMGCGRDEGYLSLVRGSVDAILLDTYSPQGGGTGLAHEWDASARLRVKVSPIPVILAGGLDGNNIGCAIRTVRPFAVDVSSGVEVNGAKDPNRIRDFIKNAKGCL